MLIITKVIKMAITYERTMKFEYEGNISENEFSKLSSDLHDKGISMTCPYHSGISVEDDAYGYNTVVSTKTRYHVLINNEKVLDVPYRSDAQRTYEGLETFFENNSNYEVSFEEDEAVSSRKQWIKPEGRYCNIQTDGIMGRLADRRYNCLIYSVKDSDEEVVVEVYLERKWGNVVLTFKTTWETDKVQRKQTIESTMVDAPVQDMGLIQSTLEGRLALKKYGFDVENVTIECHFDAKTESRSECTPDIINKVREARTNR